MEESRAPTSRPRSAGPPPGGLDAPGRRRRRRFRGFRADRGLDLAGSLAFTTLLTAVPLLATFSLFLVTFFQENDDADPVDRQRRAPLPDGALSQSLRDFIAESTAISGVGLAPAGHRLGPAGLRRRGRLQRRLGRAAPADAPDARRPLHVRARSRSASCSAASAGASGPSATRPTSTRPLELRLVAAPRRSSSKAVLLTLLYRYLPNARVRLARGGRRRARRSRWRSSCCAWPSASTSRRMLRMNLITGSLGVRPLRHPVALPRVGADPPRRRADARPADARRRARRATGGARGARRRRSGCCCACRPPSRRRSQDLETEPRRRRRPRRSRSSRT